MTEANVIYLGAHERMTADEALSSIQQYEWADVLCCGYDQDGEFQVVSSHLPRSQALWLAMALVDYVRRPESP